ncbi:murein biosynthesis integral membrane protein MurJ [Lysinibacillus sp. NPDC096418]|uniref:murein biosynthesis integral membrane protein MurJ n=1 Tax=Lysinibacillus sp. NPDC096418 TaxID=3364138 RepID=UPI0038303271
MEDKKGVANNIFKASIIVFILTLGSRILGFVREWIIATLYGTEENADAFHLAFSIPEILDRFLITGALSSILISYFIKLKDEQDKLAIIEFYTAIKRVLVVFSLFLSVLVAVFSKELLLLLSPNLNENILELAIPLLRIMIFANVFLSLTLLIKSYLDSNKKFIVSAFAPIIQNLFFITLVLLTVNKFNINSLAIVYLISVILQYLYLVKFSGVYKEFSHKDMKIRFNKDTIDLFKMALPVIFTMFLTEINVFIDKIVASNYSVGSVAALSYANKLIHLPIGILGGSLLTVFMPYIASSINTKTYDSAGQYQAKLFRVIIIVTTAMISFYWIFSSEIITYIFGYGNFEERAINQTAYYLKGYAITILLYLLILALIRTYHLHLDVVTPMKIGVVTLIIKFASTYFLVENFGVTGAIYSTVFSMICGTALLVFFIFDKIYFKIGKRTILFTTQLIFVNGIFTAILLYMKSTFLINSSIYTFIFIVILVPIIYSVLLLLAKVDEMRDLINIIKRRILK